MIEKKEILLKDFRKYLKAKGYTVKTKIIGFIDLARDTMLSIKIYDNNTLINQNVMTKEHYNKYKDTIQYINSVKVIKGN